MALFWDAGGTGRAWSSSGIVDPGRRYTGELPRPRVVINEAAATGPRDRYDLLARFAAVAPLDLFGIDAGNGPADVTGIDDLPQAALHTGDCPAGACTCTRSAGLARPVAARGHAPRAARDRAGDHRRPRGGAAEAGVVSTRLDVLTTRCVG